LYAKPIILIVSEKAQINIFGEKNVIKVAEEFFGAFDSEIFCGLRKTFPIKFFCIVLHLALSNKNKINAKLLPHPLFSRE
jgi:hypothetical protein